MSHPFTVSAPVTQVVISNMPRFIKYELIMKELAHFRKFTSPMTSIPLRCNNSAVKHVPSFHRQVFIVSKQL